MAWEAISAIATVAATSFAAFSAWQSGKAAADARNLLQQEIKLLEENAKKTAARDSLAQYHALALAHPAVSSGDDLDQPYHWFVSFAAFMVQRNLEAYPTDLSHRARMKQQLSYYKDAFIVWSPSDKQLYGDEVSKLIDEIVRDPSITTGS